MRAPRSRCCTRGVGQVISLASPTTQRQRNRTRTVATIKTKLLRLAGRAMFESVRIRLTFWYAGVLALFLVVLSVATYFIFWRSTLQRTDSDLSELSDAFLTTVRAELEENRGSDALKIASQVAIVEHNFREHIFAILDARGAIVISSQDLPNHDSVPKDLLSSDAFVELVKRLDASQYAWGTMESGGSSYRGLTRRFQARGQMYTLVVLRSLRQQQQMLAGVAETFAWVIPISVLLASVGGYFLARKSLAPVVAMSNQAGHISAANLHERLHVKNERDELGHLAGSFNQLLERVDQSFERQRR